MSKKPNKKSTKARKSNANAQKKKPLIIQYDENGRKIGDDGYPLTSTRRRMHFIFNALLIIAILVAIYGGICSFSTYFQGQVQHAWDSAASGGVQFHGYDFAAVLRAEGILALLTAIAYLLSNFLGFAWMYDGRSGRGFYIVTGLLAAISAGYIVAAATMLGVIEPLGIINLAIIAITWFVMQQTRVEKPTLKKAKVARTVEKK